jgi:glycosyltransferase involved in cell wall biosynthesis
MIKAIVCGYKSQATIARCLASIECQSYGNYQIVHNEDSENDRKYLVYRTIQAIEQSGAHSDDIVACVDADDFLCDPHAFQIIADSYNSNPDLLLTYGSYVNLSSNKCGKFCKPYLAGESFRTSDWRGSHLKTFKYKLWKQLPDSELRDEDGEYFKCCADRAMMVPMMELAGYERISHIPMIIYCYNDLNPDSVWNTMKDLSKTTRELISSRPSLI